MNYRDAALAAMVSLVFYVLAWRLRPAPAATPGGDALPFDTNSPDYGRGVEFGLLFARVQDHGCVRMAVHADMAEAVMRLAESRDLPFCGRSHEHVEECSRNTGDRDCKDGSEWLDVMIG